MRYDDPVAGQQYAALLAGPAGFGVGPATLACHVVDGTTVKQTLVCRAVYSKAYVLSLSDKQQRHDSQSNRFAADLHDDAHYGLDCVLRQARA